MALILASGSPRRKELLALITPEFEIEISDVEESGITAPTPAQLAEALAKTKCLSVAQSHPKELCLGCDTVVECEGRVFGKPKDADDARWMLTELSGKKHAVHTGFCLARGSEIHCETVTSVVEFYPIDPVDLETYLLTPEAYDKAGGYAIQGHAALWCRGIEGCYYNIMGLPVSRVARALQKFGKSTRQREL